MRPAKTYYPLKPRGLPETLSIVVTIYNEEEALPFLRRRLTAFLGTLRCHADLVMVNDGSSDNSIKQLLDWAEADSRVRVLNLARNFGHQMAATAGLDAAVGDAVVLMDADLQDPPEVIASMVEEYRKGYDVVYGRRASRTGETIFKRASAWLFYRAMRLLIHPDLPSDVGDFRLISRPCLNALLSLRETHRFLRGMVTWVGFPQTAVDYIRDSRVSGETKYPVSKMLALAWTAAVSFSPLPLRLSFAVGLIIAAIGMMQAINAVVRSILGLHVVEGWSSIIVVNCLVGGAVLISIGVLGEYVGRIFEAVKERPLYVVASDIKGKGALVRDQSSKASGEIDPVATQLAALSGVSSDR